MEPFAVTQGLYP